MILPVCLLAFLFIGLALFRSRALYFPIRGRHVKSSLVLQVLMIILQGVQTVRSFVDIPCALSTVIPGIGTLILTGYCYRIHHIMLRMRTKSIQPISEEEYRHLRRRNLNAVWTSSLLLTVLYITFYLGSPRYTENTCKPTFSPLFLCVGIWILFLFVLLLHSLWYLWKYPNDVLGLRYEVLCTTIGSLLACIIVGLLHVLWNFEWLRTLSYILLALFSLCMAWIPAVVSFYIEYQVPASSPSSSPTLYDTLERPQSRSQFQDFLREEMSLENLMFYEEVSSWINSEGTIDEAKVIQQKFLEPGPYEVNLGNRIRNQILKAIEEKDLDSLGQYLSLAREQIFHLMNHDSFRRFQASMSFIHI